MAAYIVVEVKVADPVGYVEYVQKVPASLAVYGGEFIARGGATEHLEGEWEGRIVILRFDSMERATAWYHSPEYAEAKALRHRYSTGRMVAVEGVA